MNHVADRHDMTGSRVVNHDQMSVTIEIDGPAQQPRGAGQFDAHPPTESSRMGCDLTPNEVGIGQPLRQGIDNLSKKTIAVDRRSELLHGCRRRVGLDRGDVETDPHDDYRRWTVDPLGKQTGQLSHGPARRDDQIVGPFDEDPDTHVSIHAATRRGGQCGHHLVGLLRPGGESKADQQRTSGIDPLAVEAATTRGLVIGHEHHRIGPSRSGLGRQIGVGRPGLADMAEFGQAHA